MKKDPVIFLDHILQSIKNIEEDTAGFSKEQFLSRRTIQDAVIRNIEVMGEAAKNIPDDFRRKYESVPWKEIAGTRDKVIHGYFGVDLNIVWDVIRADLPKLKKEIKHILEQER